MVRENDVMVFSKSTCPFCNKLKAAFDLSRVDYASVEIDTLGQLGVDMQKELLEKTGQKTVPNVFIKGNHIGELYENQVQCGKINVSFELGYLD